MFFEKKKIEEFLLSNEKYCIVRGNNFDKENKDINFWDTLRTINKTFNEAKVLIRFVDYGQRDRILKTRWKTKECKKIGNIYLYADSIRSYGDTPDNFDIILVYASGSIKDDAFVDITKKDNSKTIWFFSVCEENLFDIKDMLEIPDELVFEYNPAHTLEELEQFRNVRPVQVDNTGYHCVEESVLKAYGYNNEYVNSSSMGQELTCGQVENLNFTISGGRKSINALIRVSDNFETNKTIFIKFIN